MMKLQISLALLLVSGICLTLADRPSHMLKARRGSYIQEPAALARSNDQNAAGSAVLDQLSGDLDKLDGVPVAGAGAGAGAGAVGGTSGKKDASSGRLFLKKFLMFKNMFSSNNQPVIPIIITNPGSPTTTSSPTVSVTSTGSIPSATGTITTTPTATGTTTTSGRNYNNEQEEDDEMAADDAEEQLQSNGGAGAGAGSYGMAANAELLDEQTMQAALAAGAQEYEVISEETDQTNLSKATQNNRINLRRKGGRRGQGQVISVRIPPRYRRYFKNGQKVMLNTKNRPNKRRVVRKRFQNNNKRINNRRRGGKNKNKKGKGKNKNKRPRFTAV